jgi:hypothetical protein
VAGIALVHADHGEPAGEVGHGIHPRRRNCGIARAVPPELELRAQAAGREEQQGMTRTVHFVVDLGLGTLEDRHRYPPESVSGLPRHDTTARSSAAAESAPPSSAGYLVTSFSLSMGRSPKGVPLFERAVIAIF